MTLAAKYQQDYGSTGTPNEENQNLKKTMIEYLMKRTKVGINNLHTLRSYERTYHKA